jgi:hypothetical protein
MAGLTTADLLKSIRQVANLPEVTASDVLDSTTEYTTDVGILSVATRELQTFIAPKIMAQREEFFVATKTYTVSAAYAKYRLPSRAIGSKLKYVAYVPSGGSVNTDKTTFEELSASHVQDGDKDGYYLEGAYIKLRSSKSSGTLYVTYYARPSKLVVTTSAAVITGIAGQIISLSGNFPSTLTSASKLDIIKATSPYEVCDSDLAYSAGTGTASITVTGTISTDWEVGDYLAVAEESPVVQAPQDLHNWLTQRVAVKILDLAGYKDDYDRASKELKAMEETAIASITPRSENKRQPVKNKSLWGF